MANTRTLAALAIRSGIGDLSEQTRDKTLAILEQQVEALGEAVRLINVVAGSTNRSGECTYSDDLTRLVRAILQLAELEKARFELSQEGVSNP